jgi:hypothetical protein
MSIVLALTMLALQVGCADTAEIKQAIRDSNQAVIDTVNSQNNELFAAIDSTGSTAVLGAMGVYEPAVGDDNVPPDRAWIVQVDKIERYISAHPDQLRTINALRLRQATILMQAQQKNLAKLAFEQVDGNQLFSERDRALLELQDEFIWWYSIGSARLSDEDRMIGRGAMAELGRVAEPLPKKSTTRRLLEEMRVRIGTRVANTLGTEEGIRSMLEDATGRYGDQFSPTDKKLVQAWHTDTIIDPDSNLLQMLRWYDYVPAAFESAETVWRRATGNSSGARQFTPDWVACITDDQLQCE